MPFAIPATSAPAFPAETTDGSDASGTGIAKSRTPRKNRGCVGVLFDVPVNPYGDVRLARLLSLFRPAPQGWVMKAQRIPLDMSVRDPVAEEGRLTDGDLAELARKLEIDPM